MKSLLAKLLVLAAVLGTPCTASTPSSAKSRYVYCNVYASTLCFGIAAGDKASISIPVDFVLYDVRLLDKVSGSIYIGGHLEAVEKSLILYERNYPSNGGAGSYTYRLLKGGEHVITYIAPNSNAPLAQIRLHAEKGDQARLLGDFLGNFRPCSMESAKVSCSDRRVFSKLVSDRFQGP